MVFRKAGKVKAAHGIKGELAVHLFAKDTSWCDQVQEFYLSTQDLGAATIEEIKFFEHPSARVYSVTKIRPHKEGLLIQTKEVCDRNGAEALKGQYFFISDELLVSKPGETIFLSEIQGFSIRVTTTNEDLGAITGFSSNGAQDLLLILYKGTEVAIPFVDDFITDIDFKKKVILMDLPEGLLEVNFPISEDEPS